MADHRRHQHHHHRHLELPLLAKTLHCSGSFFLLRARADTSMNGNGGLVICPRERLCNYKALSMCEGRWDDVTHFRPGPRATRNAMISLALRA